MIRLDIAALRDTWQKQRYQRGTVLQRLAVLSHAFEFGCKVWGMEGLMNPARLVSHPTVRNGRESLFTEAGLDAIYAAS